jgi:hypothetical protein
MALGRWALLVRTMGVRVVGVRAMVSGGHNGVLRTFPSRRVPQVPLHTSHVLGAKQGAASKIQLVMGQFIITESFRLK